MQKSTKTLLLVVLTVALVSTMMMFSGCSSSSSDPTPAPGATLVSVAVTPASASIAVGATQQYTATGTYSDATTAAVTATWTSSSTGVASINAAGIATGVAAGTTTITATSGSIPSTGVTLTVTPAAATKTTYTGTLYMASEGGGHVGVFPVTIDPTAATPITVDTAGVGRIQLKGQWSDSNNKITFHDLRLDGTKLYYSAFLTSPSGTGSASLGDYTNTNSKTYLGYVDLTTAQTNGTTNQGVSSFTEANYQAADNIALAVQLMGVDPTGYGRMIYCASGAATVDGVDYFMPMTMTFPAYIDVFKKSDLATASTTTVYPVTRTYIDRLDDDAILGTGGMGLGNPPLAFLHGSTNNAGTKMFAITNVVSGLTPTDNLAGVFRSYMINTSDLVTQSATADPLTPGLVSSVTDTTKVISKASYTVGPSASTGSIAFRSSWSPDDSLIFQAGQDRMLVINASDLSLNVDTDTFTTKIGGGLTGIENHDVMVTPDGKYAILAIRYFSDATQDADGHKTSGLQLYDINNKAFVGGITSTCGASAGACHAAEGDGQSRPTCGLVGSLTAVTQ